MYRAWVHGQVKRSDMYRVWVHGQVKGSDMKQLMLVDGQSF